MTKLWYMTNPKDFSREPILRSFGGASEQEWASLGCLLRIAEAVESLADPNRQEKLERAARRKQDDALSRDRHEEAHGVAYERICAALPDAINRKGVSARSFVKAVSRRLGFRRFEWSRNDADYRRFLAELSTGSLEASDLSRPGCPKHARIAAALKSNKETP